MQNGLVYIVSSLLDLYVVTFFLRLALGWVRADFRNPIAQFVLKVTNPLVIPTRRFIPPAGGVDLATLAVLLVLQSAATGILVKLACVGSAEIGQVIALSLFRLAELVLSTYSLLMLVYVISSWVMPRGYNPAMAVLASLVEPVLAPFRRVIPPIAGFDLSPVFALLLIGFITRVIPSGAQVTGLACPPF
jgi:YggT family protein